MKISLRELKVLISEAVDKKLQEHSPTGDIGRGGVNWAELKYQFAKGRLEGSWRLIMTAMEETGGDQERALQLLKAAVAKFESKKSPPPPQEEEPEEMDDPVFRPL